MADTLEMLGRLTQASGFALGLFRGKVAMLWYPPLLLLLLV
jgi:hypothetical protein